MMNGAPFCSLGELLGVLGYLPCLPTETGTTDSTDNERKVRNLWPGFETVVPGIRLGLAQSFGEPVAVPLLEMSLPQPPFAV